MRRATYALCLFDLAATLLIVAVLLGSGSDPATRGLDVAAAAAVALVAGVTGLPALVLLRLDRAPFAALMLAAAFPLLFLLLFLIVTGAWS